MEKRMVVILAAALCCMLVAGCEDNSNKGSPAVAYPEQHIEPAAGVSVSEDETGSTGDISGNRTQESLSSFHYQLQGATYNSLSRLDVDVMIIDPDDAGLDSSEIEELRKKGVLVLAYLSIGEAEDYRDYWQAGWKSGSPDFIDKENPEWEGNYKVKYWDSEWQDIILGRVKDIAETGYDGVYLDIIDAYGYYEDEGRDSAAQEMIAFVRAIRDKAVLTNPDFLIVPQNAPELYAYKEYANIIDGFGKEDTWYDDDSVQDSEETDYVLTYLDHAIEDGRFVLAIDYPSEKSKICGFYSKCSSHGFACTVSDRELDMDSPVLCT